VARVKGTLFVDYVRMLRAKKGADWARYLTPTDLVYLTERIQPDEWYPMAAFERMGIAILDEIAERDLGLVHLFGRHSIDWLCVQHPNLIAPGDPRESLMRFQVLRQGFFDYPAVQIREINDSEVTIDIAYGMGDRAEEAASHQTSGFFSRLLEMSGAQDVKYRFLTSSWEGATKTILSLSWK
jgi:hypothetical protein